MRTRTVVVGVGALGVVVLAAVLAPRAAGMVMVTFSVVVFLWAAVGLIRPSWARLPDRMAAVWVWALSVGLFIGGAVALSPPPEVTSTEEGLRDRPPAAVDLGRGAEQFDDPCQAGAGDMRGWHFAEIQRVTDACAEQMGLSMAEEWARTAYAPLDMQADTFFAQMPDELESAEWTGRREHTMTWSDGSVVVTRWREGEPGRGLRLDYIDRIGR